MINAYILALIIASTSFIGLLFSRKANGFASKYSAPLLGVSVGILCVTVFHLGFEAFEESEHVWYTAGALLLGIAFAEALHRFSHETHCHHGHEEHEHAEALSSSSHGAAMSDPHVCAEPSEHKDEVAPDWHAGHSHHVHASMPASSAASERVLRKIVVGDSVHNLIDGFTLAAVSVSFPLAALPLAFSMFLHESVQEIAEFLILKEAGIPRKKIVLYNVISGLAIVLGVFLGLSVSFIHEIVPYLAGFSAGILAHFMLYDGLSIVFKKRKEGLFASHLINFIYICIGATVGYALLETLTTHI